MPGIQADSLDHVALWVGDRDNLTAFLTNHLGMHVIKENDQLTLLGADAHRGKLTLFDAEGSREPGPLGRVVLRVNDLDAALEALPGDLPVERRDEVAEFEGPGGVPLGLTGQRGVDYDIDHVVIRVSDSERAAETLAELGFERHDGALTVADKTVVLEDNGGGHGGQTERPLLNHIALLVDSAAALRTETMRRGVKVDRMVDADNTRAVFVRGPDGIMIEYVEHKPGFSLS